MATSSQLEIRRYNSRHAGLNDSEILGQHLKTTKSLAHIHAEISNGFRLWSCHTWRFLIGMPVISSRDAGARSPARGPETLSSPISSNWLGLGWLVLVAVILIACGSTVSRLVELWQSNPEYSHGFFVPLFTLWILYTRREEIQQSLWENQSAAVFMAGIGLILLGGGVRVAGIFTRALSIEGAALPIMLAGVCFAALGRVTAFRLLPALMFLVFMVPVPGLLLNDLGMFLQGVATEASTVCFQLVGIPAMNDGIVIALPNTELQIAEACSGIRMLITLAAMVSAYCIVSQRTPFEKVLLLFSVVPIAVTVNVLRIVATGAAHESLPSWGDAIHDAAGWFMMIAGFLLLSFELWIFARLFSPPEEGY